ncbi:MAG: hypothetical protein JWO90_3129 [Solirubrobacterales bacterium]|nr:hypothetical protein [Solirubrobacterales bacterium]
MTAVDVHQHLWPAELLRALARRTTAPCARPAQGGWLVELPGEPAFLVDPADHDVVSRAAAVHAAGLDRALVALSTPVGIEALPAAEAAPLLEAWNEAAATLPDTLGWWGSVPLAAAAHEVVEAADAALDAGAAGIVVAAGALAAPEGLRRQAPLLHRLQERLAPLFVHPGPAPRAAPAAPVPAAWWAPATRYVTDLHAAWHAWAGWGRPRHPRLHVVWAALAGLAPLHAERTGLRGGPEHDEPDPFQFYDTSGYGPRALTWMACSVGTSQLVHGTDAPVVAGLPAEPFSVEASRALRTDNVARLLGTAWVAA